MEVERVSVASRSNQADGDFRPFRLTGAEVSGLFDAVNRSVAEESALVDRISLVRRGETLTQRLEIAKRDGWFRPMLNDLLREGVSVVVNDIEITDSIAHTVAAPAQVPPDWITQQNLYITPCESQGFDPHCDPHIVIVVQLYGRKEWTIYDKTLEDPVYDSETNTVADKSNPLGVLAKITVGPGDCFVIPRGRYHSAIALSAASVHLAVGTAGARALDNIWAMADRALRDPAMRADLTPEDALERARAYIREHPLEPVRLPRFPRALWDAATNVSSLSFEDVLDGLPAR